MNFVAMCLGYLIITVISLWVFANLYWHTHMVVCEIIAYMIMERPAKIKLCRLPIVFAKRWYESWSDFSDETTITWYGLGSWTTPRHIFSMGEYSIFESIKPLTKPPSDSLKAVKDPTLEDD